MSPTEIATALLLGHDSYRPEHLPDASKRALKNLAAGLSSDHGLVGRSQFGGHNATIRSLARQGLVKCSHDEGIVLTDAGRLAAQRIAKASGAIPECTCAAKDMPFGRCCKATGPQGDGGAAS